MLARLAENLFWAGRYVERAEGTARTVDVTYHTLLESSHDQREHLWEQLLAVLHVREGFRGQPVIGEQVMQYVVSDRRNESSIIASVVWARENIRSVRDHVSSELWEAVNDLHLALTSRELADEIAEQPYELFGTIRRGCTTIYGAASDTMPRDEAWRFMALGRMLERAEMTCRLIDVGYAQLEAIAGPSARLNGSHQRALGADRTDFHQWVALLKSASSFEAYRRRYRSSMDPADVVEFLMLAPDLPRSVLFALTGAMHQVEALCHGRPTSATRRLGRIVAALQYRDVTELFEVGLHDFLDTVEHDIAQATESIADEFFRHQVGGMLHAVATS